MLSDFIELLSEWHSEIKFTVTSSETTLPFLDLEIRVINNELRTTLHKKETDRNTILHYRSAHPRSLRESPVWATSAHPEKLFSR